MEQKIYYIPNIQYLVYEDQYDLRLENNPMNRFDTLFYKGSTNTLDFSIRDKDRKPIKLHDKTLTIYITNVEAGTITTTKELQILDVDRGFARLTLLDGETASWDEGFYSYALHVTEENGRQGFAFTDQTYRVTGNFELSGDAVPFTSNNVEVVTFTATDNSSGSINPTYYSSAIQYGNGTLHTAVFYLDCFLGEVGIQVTLDAYPPTNPDNWATIASQTYNVKTEGLEDFLIDGNYTFIRFYYDPHELNTGSITKVLYQ